MHCRGPARNISRDGDAFPVDAPRRLDDDFYMLAKRNECLHQPLKGNVLELVTANLGNFGLGHAGNRCCFHLAQAALVYQFIKLIRESGLCRQFFRIVETEIQQYIVGAFGVIIVIHYYLPLAP